jgi:hypothetical protein
MWSDGANVVFRRNRVAKASGASDIGIALTPSPYYIQPYFDETDNTWIVCDYTTIYSTDGATQSLLGSGFTASASATWTGCNLNSVAVLNNRNNHPQIVNPDTHSAVVDLPNWNAALSQEWIDDALAGGLTQEEIDAINIWNASSRCEVMRSYKNYLVALDCYDQNGVRYPEMIRWSSGAEAGDVPPSWDAQITNETAGMYSLSDTPGAMLDGLSLGDYFVIYKDDSVWLMQLIGGDFTMSFRKLFGREGGALSKECIADFEGRHFVMTPDGAYVHNGSQREEVMEKWVYDEWATSVSQTYKTNTKVVTDVPNKEIWIYYPDSTTVSGEATRALIWNWDVNKWTIRDLSGINYISLGRVEPDDITFKLVMADATNKKLYENETGTQELGVDFTGFVERIGLDFGDDRVLKYVSRIVPHIRNSTPTPAPVTIKIYAEEVITESPTEELSVVFTPGTDHDIDCHLVGRWIGVRFEGTELFDMTGFTIEWEPAGYA